MSGLDGVDVHVAIRLDIRALHETLSDDQIKAVLNGIAECLSGQTALAAAAPRAKEVTDE